MFHDSIVCFEQSGMDAPVVFSDLLPLSEDGIQTIRLSPDHRPILLRSKAKSDIRHVGEQVWRGSILMSSYMIEQSVTRSIVDA